MHSLRIVLNATLALAWFGGGFQLLGKRSFFLPVRGNSEAGLLFPGVPLYCLAAGLIFLGAFAGAVALGWVRGTLPPADPKRIRPHPSWKGALIVRYGYGVLPALALILLAFLLAEGVPPASL